jgi:hypothetical protein
VKRASLWKSVLALILLTGLIAGTSLLLAPLTAQNTGYRFGGNGMIFAGPYSGPCFEPSINAGPDGCLLRLGAGQVGATLGGPNTGWAQVPPPPVVALATATTGGTIPAGTSYRLALTYMTINGGETNITATQEATQTTTGATSTITATAPIAAAGAAGYRVWSTNASGVGAGNATLTELLQPINTTVCAGAFQVNGPNGVGTGPFVCPIGTNAVLTSLVTTAGGNVIPNIPGTATQAASGIAIPANNTAAYPAMIPELIANVIAMPALTTVTTAQTFVTIPLTAGVQNVVGKVIRITGHIIASEATTGSTFTLAVTEGGITPMTITSIATTGALTNGQINFDYYLTTAANGSAGTIEGHGNLDLQPSATNTLALSRSADTLTAVSSAINLTAANNLALTIAASNSASSIQLRDAQVWLLN